MRSALIGCASWALGGAVLLLGLSAFGCSLMVSP
jgi:hypothetical protein